MPSNLTPKERQLLESRAAAPDVQDDAVGACSATCDRGSAELDLVLAGDGEVEMDESGGLACDRVDTDTKAERIGADRAGTEK